MADEKPEDKAGEKTEFQRLVARTRLIANNTHAPWAKRLLRNAGGMPSGRQGKRDKDEEKKES